jgi:hypothetical protein
MLAASAPLPALELVVPVDCELGRGCFIQQYTDHDPSPGARDYACGTAAYDGHEGTDFRLRTTREAGQGVAVLAAAEGSVSARRDGMPDRLTRTPEELMEIETRECGNGVVIDHGGGWETQYCHMKQNSLTVEMGEPVEAGQKIGETGYSGAAAFPHLHLSVRLNGESVDPFLGPEGDAEACGAGAEPLWTAAALSELEYRAGQLLDIGFAAGQVELEVVETGSVEDAVPDRRSPAIVAWGWAINLRAGDEVVVELAGPDGGDLARNKVTLDRNKAQYMLFAGTRRPDAGWPAGRYTATFSVMRQGATVVRGEQELRLE